MKQKVVEGGRGANRLAKRREHHLSGGQLLSNGKHENEEHKLCERKLGFLCVSVRLTLEFNTIKSYLNMLLDDKECC